MIKIIPLKQSKTLGPSVTYQLSKDCIGSSWFQIVFETVCWTPSLPTRTIKSIKKAGLPSMEVFEQLEACTWSNLPNLRLKSFASIVNQLCCRRPQLEVKKVPHAGSLEISIEATASYSKGCKSFSNKTQKLYIWESLPIFM